MGLFRKNEETNDRPRNPDTYFMFKLLAAGYLLYLLWDIIKMYMAGGADQPSVLLMVCSFVVLGGGAVFIGITSFNQWRRFKKEAQEQAQLEEEAAEEQDSLPEAQEEEE